MSGQSLDRRRFLASLAPAVGLAVLAPAAASAASSGLVGPGSRLVGRASGPGCATGCRVKFESVEELEAAFEQFGALSDASVASMARAQQAGAAGVGSAGASLALALPGPAAIVSCALTAAWVFRQGANRDTIAMQIAEVVVGCVGIPGATWIVLRVARLVWTYRMKIAAALSAIGLTAAQLAPLRNAKRP